LMCALSGKTQELVALAKEGDKSALNHLYRIYAERVRLMVRFRMSKELHSKLGSMDLVKDSPKPSGPIWRQEISKATRLKRRQ
jgi:hypothetical protein